jgi:HD-GYP domain-containing protein (c-di-GMP phosphodiesterase class II)
MRKHPQYAYDLLTPIPYLRPALDIPYCHHEHWDGSGYPRGLKATQIPLSARLFSIVDIWDALLSDRPYRNAWPRAKVLEYLNEISGTILDPTIVRAFLEMITEDVDKNGIPL